MTPMSFDDFIEKVQQWADEKGLICLENFGPQIEKLKEELDEFLEATFDGVHTEIEKEWADVLVVWIITGFIKGVDVHRAIELTWNKIKDRKGRLVNGQFVKEV